MKVLGETLPEGEVFKSFKGLLNKSPQKSLEAKPESENKKTIGKEDFDDIIRKSELDDITWKLKTRAIFGYSLLALLFIQNAILFGLIISAFIQGSIKDLEIIFGIIVPATLAETAYSIKIIVEWLFKDINYQKKESDQLKVSELLQ